MLSLRKALLVAMPLLALAGPAPPATAEWSGPCVPATAAPPGTPIPNCHFWRGKLKFVDDGDTIDVRLPTSTGKRKTVRVRITGIQAMEQSVYTSNPRKRRGECHALPATARLEQLLKAGRGTVRLAAQDPQSASGGRLRRSVAVKVAGVWQDVGRALVAEGHVLWLPSSVEYAWNSTYETLAQQAALTGVNLWDTDSCGGGPSATAVLRVTVHPNAKGSDFQNLNGERVKIENLDLTAPVSLAGWRLRDSTLRKFVFPSWTTIPPGGSITVRVGDGEDTESTLYWGLDDPIFENPKKDGRGMGDGAYLVDPQGDLRAWMMYPCYVACGP